MLENFEKLLKQVDNRARFLSCVLSGDIKFINRKKHELRQEFMEKGFDPLPKEGQPRAVGATGDRADNGERPDVDASCYEYLTSMSVSSLNEEYLQHLLELKKRFEVKVGLLRKAEPHCLKSEIEPTVRTDIVFSNVSDGKVMMDMVAKGSKRFQTAPRRQCKRSAAESLEASAMRMDDDDDEEAPELTYQSQEHTEIETQWSQKQESKKQRKERKKQRKESGGTGAPPHCPYALDFLGQHKLRDGFLREEIKRISSGLDGIVITHCNRDQSRVASELAK